MKESEFIELLNLYLDHEISAADAARLEAEVQSNAARRKVYEQYCRMQKACKMLSAEFVTESSTAPASERKVVAFNSAAVEAATARRKRMGNFYTIGTFAAAAACVAIVVIGRNRQAEAEQSNLAQQTIQQTAQPVATVQQPNRIMVSATDSSPGPRPLGKPSSIVGDQLLLTGKQHTEAVMAAVLQQQAEAQFAWISNLQVPPLQQPMTELRFESTPAALREGRTVGSRPASNLPANGNVEWAAIQFVK